MSASFEAAKSVGGGLLTISIWGQLNDVADADVDDAQEALVLLLELLLVKDLHGEDAVLVGPAGGWLTLVAPARHCGVFPFGPAYKSKVSFQYGFSVRFETDVVLVCSPLMVATAKGSGKPVERARSVRRGRGRLAGPGRHVTHETRLACRGHQQQ